MWLVDVVRPPLRLFYRLFFKLKISGLENIPVNGGCIIASNHLAFHDSVIIAAFIKDRYICFLAKQELFKIKIIGALLRSLGAIPVNRGSKDAQTVKNAVDYLKAGNTLCIFPEGTRIKNGIRIKGKKGAVRISRMSDVPIVPVHLKADYRIFGKIEMVIGKPIKFEIDESNQEIEITEKTEDLLNRIYEL